MEVHFYPHIFHLDIKLRDQGTTDRWECILRCGGDSYGEFQYNCFLSQKEMYNS